MKVLRVSKLTIALFVLPCLLLYICLVFVPILVSLYSGLLDWNGIGESTFVGLENFTNLFFLTIKFLACSQTHADVCRFLHGGNSDCIIYCHFAEPFHQTA